MPLCGPGTAISTTSRYKVSLQNVAPEDSALHFFFSFPPFAPKTDSDPTHRNTSGKARDCHPKSRKTGRNACSLRKENAWHVTSCGENPDIRQFRRPLTRGNTEPFSRKEPFSGQRPMNPPCEPPYPPLLFFLPAPALPKVEGPSDASWLPSLLPRGRVREMAIRQSLRRLEPDFEPGSPETGLTENGFPSLPVTIRHACRVCPSFTRTRLTGFSSFRRRRKSCPPSPTTRSSPTGCQGDPRLRRRQRVRSFSSKDTPGQAVRTTGQGSRLKEAGGRRSDCARPL